MSGAERVEAIASFYTLAGDTKPEFLGGDEISPHDILARIDAAASAGYTGIAMAGNDLRHWSRRHSLRKIRDAISASGLQIVELEMLMEWFTDGERRRASDAVRAELMEWAGVLGARHIKVGSTFSDEQVDHGRLVAEFATLCEDAARAGTVIALEPMPPALIKTPVDGLKVVVDAGAPNSGLLIDIWHVARAGVDYETLASIPAAAIVSVELMDAAKEPVGGDIFKDGTEHRLLAGEGELDVHRFVDAILATGYCGPWGDENLSLVNRARSLDEAARANLEAVVTTVSAARDRRGR